MNSWYSLIPIIGMIWVAALLFAIIDNKGKIEDPAAATQQVEPPRDIHNDLVRAQMEELLSGREKIVCDYFESKRVGLRTYLGIICIENGIVHIPVGGNVSNEHFMEHIDPVLSGLWLDYRIQFREEGP